MNFSIIVNKSEVLTLSLCIFVFPAGFHYLPDHFDRSGQFKEKALHPGPETDNFMVLFRCHRLFLFRRLP